MYFGTLKDQSRGVELLSEEPVRFKAASIMALGGQPKALQQGGDEFVLLQFATAAEGGKLSDCTQFEPGVEGTVELPDMFVRLQLLSFHAGTSIARPDRKLTVRLDMGQDNSSESTLDKLFWSVALGVEMFAPGDKKPARPSDINNDFLRAFPNKPVEIPGSLANLTFEIIEHKEPPWWRKVFNFLGSDSAATLASALGFPAITKQTTQFVDHVFNQWLGDADDCKPIIQSRPMTLALSQKAKDHFLGGQTHFPIGSLRPGFCVLVRASDAMAIIEQNPVYHATYGMLLPKSALTKPVILYPADDPFKEHTYAVFRVGMSTTKLVPLINFQ